MPSFSRTEALDLGVVAGELGSHHLLTSLHPVRDAHAPHLDFPLGGGDALLHERNHEILLFFHFCFPCIFERVLKRLGRRTFRPPAAITAWLERAEHPTRRTESRGR